MMTNTSTMKKVISALAIMAFLSAASLVLAGEMKTETITGTIQKTDEGFVLSADNGDQLMVQGQDVSDMVGKSVKATGAVSENESGMSIQITAIQELSEEMQE